MGFFKKGELKLLWKFYLAEFLEMSFQIVPLIIFIYFSESGFSLGTAALLISVSNLSGFFFEIPTGVFADNFGRKKSTLIYYFLSSLFFISIPFLHNQVYLFFAFLMWGVIITFRSGAQRAWIVDNLKKSKRDDLIQSFFTKSHIILAIGILISGIILSSIFPIYKESLTFFGRELRSLDFVWFIEGITLLFCGLILSSEKEYFLIRKRESIKREFVKFWKLSKKGFIYSFKHPVIFAIIVSALLSTIFTNIKWASSQPFMVNNGIPIIYFGYISSIFALFGIFLPLVSERLVKRIKKNTYLAILTTTTFLISMSLLFISGPIFAFLYLFIVRTNDYLTSPVEEAYFQEHAPSKQRATIGSILNIFYSLGGLIALGIGGIALNVISPTMFIFLGSFLLIPIIIVYLKIK